MGQGRGERRRRKRDRPLWLFPFTPPPPPSTAFSLDICLGFARLCFLLSRIINENPREYSWKCLLGVCRPVLRILTLFQTKKMSFSAPVFRPGGDHKTQHKHWHETEIMSSSATKRFLKIHFELAHYTFFLNQLEFWNDEHIDTPPQFLRKPYPIPDQKWAMSILAFGPKRRKNPTRWGGTNLYGFYKGVPPGRKTHQKTACEAGDKVKFLLDWLVTVRFRIWQLYVKMNLSTSLIHNRYDSIKLLELTKFILRQNYSSCKH